MRSAGDEGCLAEGDWTDRTKHWRECVKALRDFADTGKASRLNPKTARYIADTIESALRGFPPREWALGENCAYNDRQEVPPEVLALQYIAYAHAGIVKDKTAPKTVRTMYKVDVRTIRDWRNTIYAHLAWLWRTPSDPARIAALAASERERGTWRMMLEIGAAGYRRRRNKSGAAQE